MGGFQGIGEMINIYHRLWRGSHERESSLASIGTRYIIIHIKIIDAIH